MFGSKFKLRPELLQRAKDAAERLGCSVNELIERALQVELDRLDAESAARSAEATSGTVSDAEVDEIMGKLKGLGYID